MSAVLLEVAEARQRQLPLSRLRDLQTAADDMNWLLKLKGDCADDYLISPKKTSPRRPTRTVSSVTPATNRFFEPLLPQRAAP